MPASITKRDGTAVPFDSVKILNAITKANQAVGGEDMSPTDLLFVTEKVCKKLDARGLKHVEEIQDLVEETLIQYDYAKTAKAYILYLSLIHISQAAKPLRGAIALASRRACSITATCVGYCSDNV